MKGNKEIYDVLNRSLEGELFAIMQYILHSETCEHLGYNRLAAKLKQEAISEMGHAERLTERLLFLEGTPQMKMNREVKWDKGFTKNLQAQLDAEHGGLSIYHEGVELARKLGDDGSRQLFESIITEEEEHVDWIESQLSRIEQVGLENYLSQQLHAE